MRLSLLAAFFLLFVSVVVALPITSEHELRALGAAFEIDSDDRVEVYSGRGIKRSPSNAQKNQNSNEAGAEEGEASDSGQAHDSTQRHGERVEAHDSIDLRVTTYYGAPQEGAEAEADHRRDRNI
ncbi:hypothetical protein DL93DRAFT_2079824 [Clavulina sp. PMI_390]|nr:hypothetical protein DL93DRAFT_2079824 [Clavulina sp. PMI_390]